MVQWSVVQIGSLLRRDIELQLPHAGCGSDSAIAERECDSGHVQEHLTIFLGNGIGIDLPTYLEGWVERIDDRSHGGWCSFNA